MSQRQGIVYDDDLETSTGNEEGQPFVRIHTEYGEPVRPSKGNNVTPPPRFRQIRTEAERLQHLAELVPGLRHRANTLGVGIAANELHHVADLLDGILSDRTTAPVVGQALRERARADANGKAE